ncbi:Acid ceramidase N-terminal [Trinorchestia longiramus]|nr:Acid ceramidase N-terminal [Trinorchestia longiramus]
MKKKVREGETQYVSFRRGKKGWSVVDEMYIFPRGGSVVKMYAKILCTFVLLCASGHGSAGFFDVGRDFDMSHSEVKPFYGCETTAFPPNNSLLVPTYTIDLALQPRQRWTELVLANKDALVTMVGYVYNLTESVVGEKAVRFLLDNLGKVIDSVPHIYREELQGIADASGLQLEQITFYNIFYEIFSFCTSIVLQDVQGELYHGRNLDFGLFLGCWLYQSLDCARCWLYQSLDCARCWLYQSLVCARCWLYLLHLIRPKLKAVTWSSLGFDKPMH